MRSPVPPFRDVVANAAFYEAGRIWILLNQPVKERSRDADDAGILPRHGGEFALHQRYQSEFGQ
ncbi:hypothetical protein AJ87_34205 [Rhizobium yanglingense]|nr:hypothetical protein AJ87_34205 [Rhizobium yanglingense]